MPTVSVSRSINSRRAQGRVSAVSKPVWLSCSLSLHMCVHAQVQGRLINGAGGGWRVHCIYIASRLHAVRWVIVVQHQVSTLGSASCRTDCSMDCRPRRAIVAPNESICYAMPNEGTLRPAVTGLARFFISPPFFKCQMDTITSVEAIRQVLHYMLSLGASAFSE